MTYCNSYCQEVRAFARRARRRAQREVRNLDEIQALKNPLFNAINQNQNHSGRSDSSDSEPPDSDYSDNDEDDALVDHDALDEFNANDGALDGADN